MSSRSWEFRLQDILDAIGKIERYVEGMTYEEFIDDEKTVDAVIRQITVIGEAATHIPETKTSQSSQLPWRSIRGIRNIVVHEYFGINNHILWQTITNNLPELKRGLNELNDNAIPDS
mgnify:CR=1 FL=1